MSDHLTNLKKTTLTNMSVCTNNLSDWKGTINQCTHAIRMDDQSTKAFYLRSVAYFNKKQLDEALEDIVAAIKLNPQDKALRSHHVVVKEAWSKKKE